MPNLEEVIYTYYETESKEALEEVFNQSVYLMKSWTNRYTKIPRGPAFDDFVLDTALSFTGRVIKKSILDNHITVLLNMGRLRFRHEFIEPEEVENLQSDKLEDVAEMVSVVESALLKIPEKYKYVFLYELQYGKEFSIVDSAIEGDLDRLLLKYLVQEVYRSMGDTKEFEVSIPSTNSAKVLLLSALYNEQPALLVLFLLFKDLSKFLQFCSLFSGKEIKFPTITELISLFSKSITTGESLSSGKITPEDVDFLSKFAIDLNSTSTEVEVNPVLDEYCRDSIKSLVENYDSLHKRMLDSISDKNTKQLSDAFKLLNTELHAQFRLFSEVVSVANMDIKSK